MARYYNNLQAQTLQYPLATFWRYFIYISLTALIGLFGWLAYYSLTNAESDMQPEVVIPIMLLLICGCVYLLIRSYKEKLLIENDRFEHVMAYGSRVIYFTDVKGFKVDENYIHIIPQTTTVKKISLTKYIARADELKQYLADNFVNLDTEQYETALNEILTDNSLGLTEEERAQKLKKAKLLSNIVNWPAFVLAGLLWFYPTPYLLLISLGVLWPLVAIAVLKGNSLIRFDQEKNSPYPGITFGFFMPLAGVGMRLASDLSLLNFSTLWLPSIGLFTVLLITLLTGNKAFNFSSGKKTASSIIMMIFVFLYCIAASVAVNCFLDKSVPTEYAVKVIDKNITRGKSTSYHLVLEKWGPQQESEEELVSSEMYDRTQIGDNVTVDSRPGVLGAAWYVVY